MAHGVRSCEQIASAKVVSRHPAREERDSAFRDETLRDGTKTSHLCEGAVGQGLADPMPVCHARKAAAGDGVEESPDMAQPEGRMQDHSGNTTGLFGISLSDIRLICCEGENK